MSWKLMDQPYLRPCYSEREKFAAIERYMYKIEDDRTLCVLLNMRLEPIGIMPFSQVLRYANDKTVIFVEIIKKEEIKDDKSDGGLCEETSDSDGRQGV